MNRYIHTHVTSFRESNVDNDKGQVTQKAAVFKSSDNFVLSIILLGKYVVRGENNFKPACESSQLNLSATLSAGK